MGTTRSGIPGLSQKPIESGPANARYTCTRLRVRGTRLLTGPDYQRMLEMSIPQIARFIGEHGYGEEIHTLAGSRAAIDIIETALAKNLGASYQSVRSLTSGSLLLLTDWYLHRWDIVNVMTILRGKKRGLSPEKIREILVPAGDLGVSELDYLLAADSFAEVIERLPGWQLYPALTRECQHPYETCSFANLEDRLYQQYYTDLLRKCRTGVPGAGILAATIRLEIDLTNFRNLLRLRRGTVPQDIRTRMIAGGDILPEDLQHLAGVTDREEFIGFFRKSHLQPLLVDSYHLLYPETPDTRGKAETFISERWTEKMRPLHEMERAVTRIRLSRLEQLSKRNPFSILPVLVYLERKKYEISNIRAIVRGLEDEIPSAKIQQFLVL